MTKSLRSFLIFISLSTALLLLLPATARSQDVCDNGVCVPSGNPCVTDADCAGCPAGGAAGEPLLCCANEDCDDGDACTVDICDGTCFYEPLICDDGDLCTIDGCDPELGCFYDPLICDDGDLCTIDDCDPALGCFYEPLICDDGDFCTIDICDPAMGCFYFPEPECCQVELEKLVAVPPNPPQPEAIGWDGEEVEYHFRVTNVGQFELHMCFLDDPRLGFFAEIPFVAPGETFELIWPEICSETTEGLNDAFVHCDCFAPQPGPFPVPPEPVDDFAQALLDCQTPALFVEKLCIDVDQDGTQETAMITVVNPGEASLLNCELIDTLDRNQPEQACPGDGVDVETFEVPLGSLPPGGEDLIEETLPHFIGFACNTAEVCCNIDDGTGAPVIDPATGLPREVCDSADAVCVGAPEERVKIDIKPGSCPNSYNRKSRGVLPVAVVGTEQLDVTQIDPASVEVCSLDPEGSIRVGCDEDDPFKECCIGPHEGPPGPHTVVEDVATPFPGEVCDCHEEEGDGIPDLLLKFKTQELVPALGLGDLPDGALVPLVVRFAKAGEPVAFEGSDCVRLVPPGTPPNMMRVKSNLAEAWVAVAPLDAQLDGGGFAEFERTYPAGTEAALQAAPTRNGRALRGWKADDGRLVPGETFRLVVDGHIQTVEAVYGEAQRRCGLGYELALLLPPLVWLARRRRRG